MERIKSFFSVLFGEQDPFITLACKLEQKGAGMENHFDRLTNLISIIKNAQENKKGVFYTPNFLGESNHANKNFKFAKSCFIDLDNDQELPDFFPLEPSAILSREDNKRHHIYWLLNEKLEDANIWTELQKILINSYGSDSQIHNPGRLMRFPLTLNYKPELDRPLRYEFKKLDVNLTYSIEEIKLYHISDEIKKDEIIYIKTHTTNRYIKKDDVYSRINNEITHKLPSTTLLTDGDGRHDFFKNVVFVCHDYGLSEQEVFKVLQESNDKYLADKYTDSELAKMLTVLKSAKDIKGNKLKLLTKEQELNYKKEIVKEALKDWYYIHQSDNFININEPWKRSKSRDNFNAMFAHLIESASILSFIFAHNLIKHAEQLFYQPFSETILVQDNDDIFINMWAKPEIEEVENEPIWFIEHIKYLFPDSKEHNHFFNFLAHTVQKPLEKIRHALVLISKQGVGKSILEYVFKELYGETNVRCPSNDTLSERYTHWAKQCQLVFAHEVYQSEKKQFMDKMKPYISDDFIEIREMRQGSYEIRNYMNVIIATNDDTPLYLSDDDRRWCVFESKAVQRDPEYYKEFVKCAKEKSGELLWWLKQRDITEFDAGARPFMTEAKKYIINYSKSELQIYIEQAFYDKEGCLACDVIDVNTIKDEVENAGLNMRFVSNRSIEKILKSFGAEYINKQVKINGKPKRFWVIRNLESIMPLVDSGEFGDFARNIYNNYVEEKSKNIFEVN